LPISFCYLLCFFFFPKVVIAMVNMAHAIALITTISCSNCLIDHMYTLMHLYINYLHTNARFFMNELVRRCINTFTQNSYNGYT